jgi:glycine hydroxymethyltransferase
MIPGDPQSPMVTSGIRLGTPAITTRGLKEADVQLVGELIHEAIAYRNDDSKVAQIREKVKSLMAHRPLFEA